MKSAGERGNALRFQTEIRRIKGPGGELKLRILRPREQVGLLPGILWIHGGGYMMGTSAMVYGSCGAMLARKYGAVVVSPVYRLAWKAPYPAALEDCYAALLYMHEHRQELGVDRLIVGGESAGGGLSAALCIYARDRGEVRVDCQLPLYPMLDCEDTDSSRDNHGRGWDTRRNHWGWRHYLGPLYGSDAVPEYASASRAVDLAGLPPCYTFVCDGEPFYDETLTFVRRLREAGVPADADVYRGNIHGFDALFWTGQARTARRKLCEQYEKLIK